MSASASLIGHAPLYLFVRPGVIKRTITIYSALLSLLFCLLVCAYVYIHTERILLPGSDGFVSGECAIATLAGIKWIDAILNPTIMHFFRPTVIRPVPSTGDHDLAMEAVLLSKGLNKEPGNVIGLAKRKGGQVRIALYVSNQFVGYAAVKNDRVISLPSP